MARLRSMAVETLPLVAVTAALAQAPHVAEWPLDESVAEWTSLDPAARLSVTRDANVTRENGGGCLEYAYTPAIGTLSGCLVPVPGGLSGGRTLRFWMKTSDYALAMVLLAETDGSRYVAVFSSLPGHWQEVALGFDEFGLTDDTEDENGKLDPDQVAAIVFGDGIFLLAQLAKQLPFILAPDLGPRLMWLDDVSVDSETVPPRWEKTQIDGVPAVRLESFEGAPLQWLTLAGAGVEASYDKEHVADGDFSLRVVYNLPADKAFGLLTSPAGAPLAGMKRLRMSIVSKVPTVLLVELKEKDDSKYDTSVQLTGGDEFQPVNLALSGFKLADDSTDENGGLDIEQAKEFLIADISVLTQAPVTANTLWLDNIAFTE